jgi:hypothetical protein
MFHLATEAYVDERADNFAEVLVRVRTHLGRVDAALLACQQRLAALEVENGALRAHIAQLTEPGSAGSPDLGDLPGPVRAAIAARCGRGNVNRKALLESSARIMLSDPGADPREVADTLLEGSGDFEV